MPLQGPLSAGSEQVGVSVVAIVVANTNTLNIYNIWDYNI